MPPRGSQKLAILLCAFADTTNQPSPDVAHFDDLFVRRGTGGLNDYWVQASLGAINLDGSEVFGWKTLPDTRADYIAAHPSRWDKVRGAIEAFGLNAGAYAGVVAVFNAAPGDSGTSGGVLAGPGDVNVTFLAHETGHVFGLSHSFDQSDRKDADWSAPGEYFDTYDVMSAMNVASYDSPQFHQSGPLLCTANQDRLGWLPADRVWSAPAGQSSVADFDLVSLGHPEIPGYLAARVGGHYVEFRTADGWDRGLSGPCVLIHAISGANAVVIASDRAHFINEWQPGQTFGPSDVEMFVNGGARMTVVGFDVAGHTARIRVHTQIAKPIIVGPATDLGGGVSIDGGGTIIVGGKVIKVPPRGPALGMLTRLALAGHAEEALGDATAVTRTIYAEIEQMARQAQQG